jgi:hypothetical protein
LDDGVDVGALGLDFVDVETAPSDALVRVPAMMTTALVEAGTIGLGARPVDLTKTVSLSAADRTISP